MRTRVIAGGIAFCLLLTALPVFAQTGLPATQDDFFNPQVLHELRMEIRPSDWEKLKTEFTSNSYYPANLYWRFQGADIPILDLGIRSRGTGSRSGVKPGLRVDFDRYETTQTFLGLKSFVLRNNTQDASMMHEFISMAVFRRVGIPAPRQAFTKLYVNGQYQGVFTIVESVDKAFLRRHFSEDTGYLYKYDYAATDLPYLFENRGADGALYVPKPFQPETHESAPNSSRIAMMVQAINDTPAANFAAAMAQYIDFNGFLAEVAAEAFMSEQDGFLGDFGMNNYYLYQLISSGRFQFIPWDKSNTFESITRSIWHNTAQNVLMRRTLAIPGMQTAYLEALRKTMTAAGAAGGWMEQEIIRVHALIRDAVYQDPNKLCDPGHTGVLRPCTNEEFEADVSFMRQFARGRSAFVTSEIEAVTGPLAVSEQSFTIADRGGSSAITAGGAAGAPSVGYARIQPGSGATAPAGMAIFSFRQNGVLVTEAAVPAARRILSGRIFAEVNGPVNTGLAIANPNNQTATVTFYFTDPAGRNSAAQTTTIAANGQIAAFLDQSPFNGGSSVNGAFTFSSSVPVAVVALRGFTNERSEFLITTLPVVELGSSAAPASTLSHFADGSGWQTQVILINPSDQAISGTVQFVRPTAGAAPAPQPATVTIGGVAGSSFPYTIPARSSIKLQTAGAATGIQIGWIRISATNQLPEALAIFSFKRDGVTVTEAGVPAIASGTAFRTYVESGTGGIQSGLAVVNLANDTATVTFELTTLAGSPTGLKADVALPPFGHRAFFLNELEGFTALPAAFKGVLRASTSSAPGISMVGLRGRYNERGDFLITTTSPVLESSNPPSGELLFPHFVDAGGYSTQFILFSGYAGQSSSGTIRYFTQGGQPMDVRIQ